MKHQRRRAILVVLAVLVIAAAVTALTYAPRRPTAPAPQEAQRLALAPNPAPIRIGVAVGLSGANSVVAPTVVQSSQLAVEQINASGGILGRRVELEVVDDGSNGAGAQKAVETLMSDKKVDAIIAMETSAARNAVLPLLEQGKVPYLYTSFYEGRSCSPYMYVNDWVPEQQVAPVVRYLFEHRHARSFFVVGSDYAFGRGMLDFAKQRIQSGGGQIVGEEYLPVDGSDWTSIIAKIRAAKPDALISATAGGAPNLSLVKQLRASGLKLSYGNLALDESTAKTLGDAATGILMSTSYFTNIETLENKAFLTAMLIKFGASLQAPNELSVPQYEAFFLYKDAVEKAGTTQTDKVLRSLRDASFTGPRGTVRMSKARHSPLSMRLGEVRSDGSIRILQTFADVDPGVQCTGLD